MSHSEIKDDSKRSSVSLKDKIPDQHMETRTDKCSGDFLNVSHVGKSEDNNIIDRKPLGCYYCDYVFESKELLCRHEATHTGGEET